MWVGSKDADDWCRRILNLFGRYSEKSASLPNLLRKLTVELTFENFYLVIFRTFIWVRGCRGLCLPVRGRHAREHVWWVYV